MPATSYVEDLRSPQPCDHLVQLYTDEGFLARAVSEFLGTGLGAGQGAVVIATPAHVATFRRQLEAIGVDREAAEARGQLVFRDADTCLAQFMVNALPDRARFFELVRSIVTAVRASGYSSARLYGEMVDLLWNRSLPATVSLERLWTEFLAETQLTLLCAYRIDNFSTGIQRHVLPHIADCHSSLIPVEDYARLERAVARAYEDVFGTAGDAEQLREHIIRRCESRAKMPPPQAALLGLQQITPLVADAIIERAGRFYSA